MKHLRLHIIFVLTWLSFVACNERVSQEELIQTALGLKIEQWRELQLGECRRKALEEAEFYVDSILVIYSLPSKLDTIPKPPKPIKPVKPPFKTKPDTIVVQELEKDSEEN